MEQGIEGICYLNPYQGETYCHFPGRLSTHNSELAANFGVDGSWGLFQSAAFFSQDHVLEREVKIDAFFTSLHRKSKLSHRFSAMALIGGSQSCVETCKQSVNRRSGGTPIPKGSDQSSDGQQLLKQLREHYGTSTHASKPSQKKLPAQRATQQSQECAKVKLLK